MHEKEYEEYKEILLTQQEELHKRLKQLDINLDFGDDIDSFEEETDETEEFANQIGLRKTFHEELENITAALLKIKEKTYGICETCHKSIDTTLLHVQPASKMCRVCKQKK